MGYLHSMTCVTRGIKATSPARWRAYDAMCGVFWEAEGRAGATGYYRSPDPRVVLFFNDVSQHIGISGSGEVDDPRAHPLARAVYVPAGMQLWTRFGDDHQFSHLDLHIKEAWLVDRFRRALQDDAATSLLLHPREVQDVASLAPIGEALKLEVCDSISHPLVSESLALAMVTALLKPPMAEDTGSNQSGGLSPPQMRRLARLVDSEPGRRFLNAELAEAVGFSPSWFAQAFKRTTGKSPLQWQQERRIDTIKRVLLNDNVVIAEVSNEYGFADQAHFTRVFRQVTGTTPAAWMRESRSYRIAEGLDLADPQTGQI